MAKKQTCRCKQAECEECPEWIFTFADLVMLMMGFFVILWVLKPSANPKPGGPNEDLIKVEAAIRDAFGYVPNPKSSDPVDMHMIFDKARALKIPIGPGQGGETTLRRQGAEGSDPEVTTIRVGKQAVVGGRLEFDKGDAKFAPATVRMLDEIATQIRGHRNVVLVKGHTSLDDFGDAATPGQKMDLSLRRAQAAADYLTSHGVSPDILRVQGCSTFEPVIQREYSPASQVMNRRVEVEVTPTLVADLQQTVPATSQSQSTTMPTSSGQ
jgi:outer membrane protein OmpA-like peptidoglycan-associated protein